MKCSNVYKFGFKIVFHLTVTGSTATTTPYLKTCPEGNILGNLSLKVKKLSTLIGDVKTVFKLQVVNLSLIYHFEDLLWWMQ